MFFYLIKSFIKFRYSAHLSLSLASVSARDEIPNIPYKPNLSLFLSTNRTTIHNKSTTVSLSLMKYHYWPRWFWSFKTTMSIVNAHKGSVTRLDLDFKEALELNVISRSGNVYKNELFSLVLEQNKTHKSKPEYTQDPCFKS